MSNIKEDYLKKHSGGTTIKYVKINKANKSLIETPKDQQPVEYTDDFVGLIIATRVFASKFNEQQRKFTVTTNKVKWGGDPVYNEKLNVNQAVSSKLDDFVKKNDASWNHVTYFKPLGKDYVFELKKTWSINDLKNQLKSEKKGNLMQNVIEIGISDFYYDKDKKKKDSSNGEYVFKSLGLVTDNDKITDLDIQQAGEFITYFEEKFEREQKMILNAKKDIQSDSSDDINPDEIPF